MSAAYRPNDASVIYEVIDGEAVMINLDSGNYYTLNDSGAFIWEFVKQQGSVADIAGLVARRYGKPVAEIESSVAAFFGHLTKESLILPVPANGSALSPPSAAATPYAPPELMVFSDMQDLLLLDPIHEIDEQGWPYTAPKKQDA
jgi:hypothetical protein